jgi:branched-chain amino acid aminotransferase
VVAPIEVVGINGIDYVLPAYTQDNLMNRVKNKLERIRTGLEEDVYGWNCIV